LLIRKPADIRPSEITSKALYLDRRNFIRSAAFAGGSVLAGPAAAAIIPEGKRAKLSGVEKSEFSTDEPANSYADITTYNNYYEFGLQKEDPLRNSEEFEPRPWSITVSGHADKTGTFQLEDIVKPHKLEERIYRLRCVEAWSMVIPWVGIPLADVIRQFAPQSAAKYVVFRTLNDHTRMPGQRSRVLRWPYVEGLTMAEASNPLPILAVGLYGEVLPNQNGAPLRVHIPWKYGFKSGKSIVRIRLTDTMPRTTWAMTNPREYGFYANVNPTVDHPRWSQAKEKRLPGFFANRPTLMFNGYGDQVAGLYTGMDLKRNY
jgi:sulfoxide reductase catalytic subunit YedY